MIRSHVSGTENLIRSLREAKADVNKEVRAVLKEQVKVIRDDAKSRCSFGTRSTGALKESIRTFVSRKKIRAGVIAGGKYKGKDIYYAPFVEFGRRAIKKGEKTKTSTIKRHRHDIKAVPPQPFLYPAARAHEDETKAKLVATMTAKLKKRVEK